MAFLTQGMAILGGSGFSLKCGSSRCLRTASGYPATLYATIADKPKSLTVYGADGGVGDKTVNLFDRKGDYIENCYIARDVTNSPTTGKIAPAAGITAFVIPINADTDYTFAVTENVSSLGTYFRYGFALAKYTSASGSLSDVYYYPAATFASAKTHRFHTPENVDYMYVNIGNIQFGDDLLKNFMLLQGSYTDNTMPKYEPYGYRIPILAQGRNLFDGALLQGSINGSDGTDTATSNMRIRTNGYSEVKSAATYTLNATAGKNLKCFVFEYNKNYVFIDRIPSAWATLPYTFTTSNTASYIRFVFIYTDETVITVNDVSNIQIEQGSTATSYEPYINKTINLYASQQLAARESRNLFDASACVSGVLSSNGTITNNSSYVTSDYIPCVAGAYYSFNFNITYPLRVCYYNSSKAFLSQVTNQSARAFMTPANAAYIRVSTSASFAYSAMVVSGRYTDDTMPAYEPYGTIADTLTIADNTATLSPKATGGDDTDITALQDWTQDMTLPEAEQLTVSAGTAVEPESITIEYYSKLKGES